MSSTFNLYSYKWNRFWRKLVPAVVVVGAFAGLMIAERTGAFGRPPGDDWHTYHDQKFIVVKVVDGDTINIAQMDNIAGYNTTRVRLFGVDTPESVRRNTPVQYFGPEASAFTKEICLNREVRIELAKDNTRGKYGRLLAYVWLDDETMLNRLLVARGFGYWDPRFKHPREKEFRKLHYEAMEAKVGLWKNVAASELPRYIRPKVPGWRKRRRRRRQSTIH